MQKMSLEKVTKSVCALLIEFVSSIDSANRLHCYLHPANNCASRCQSWLSVSPRLQQLRWQFIADTTRHKQQLF